MWCFDGGFCSPMNFSLFEDLFLWDSHFGNSSRLATCFLRADAEVVSELGSLVGVEDRVDDAVAVAREELEEVFDLLTGGEP
jgi:hypothetical protein